MQVMTGMGAVLRSGLVRFSYRHWLLLGNARLRGDAAAKGLAFGAMSY
jgi:hypothetical protein